MKNFLKYILFISITLLLSPAFAGDVAKGKTKAELCSGCHGAVGISTSPIIPNLAGQKEAYIISSLKDFKSGSRKNGMMSPIAATLSDDDMNDIAAFFSSLK